ncbi:MAG: PH domain-containing protein [Oscillospiraceae bacterium]|nr:PH domain-containing protein [Oscillospiraceae bacterium]
MASIEYLWKDRKRRFGLPLSFTRYCLSEDRLFCETGFLNLKSDEVLLYRVQDLELTMRITQRIFGVGTVCVHSSDKTMPHLDLKNVKNPREVKELIHQCVEQAKDKRRMRATEVVGKPGGPAHLEDCDGLDFDPEDDHD